MGRGHQAAHTVLSCLGPVLDGPGACSHEDATVPKLAQRVTGLLAPRPLIGSLDSGVSQGGDGPLRVPSPTHGAHGLSEDLLGRLTHWFPFGLEPFVQA